MITVQADVFPVNLTLDGTRLDTTLLRVIVTGGASPAVYVYRDAAGGPTLVFFDAVTAYVSGDPHIVTTRTDRVLTFSRARGCGCGSQLRAFNPFSSIPSVNATQPKDPS